MVKSIITFIFAWFSCILTPAALEDSQGEAFVGSVEAALKKEKNILQSGLTSGASAAVAEIIAEGITGDSMSFFAKAKARDGKNFDAKQTEQDWLKHANNAKSLAQLGTATLALSLNADVNKAISSAQNATENNFIGCAITAGFIAYEIYDLYDTCKNESAGAALKKVAVSGVLAVCGVTQQIGKS
jgi:hypothetical protein